MNWVNLTALAFLVAGAAGCRTALVRPPSDFPYHDDISFRGFAEEALHGHATPRTHRFDDYTKGSYHVRPGDLVEGLFRIAPLFKLRLQTVVVVGSYGPLWAYDVLTVIAEEDCTRVNWLHMPHARITVKRSGCVPPASVSAFTAEMRAVTPLREPRADGESCLVVAEGSEPHWSAFGCYATPVPADLERLQRALDRLLPSLTLTYSAVSR